MIEEKSEHRLPYRLGKKQKRAVIDANGKEVVVFPKGKEKDAEEYVKLINNTIHDSRSIYS